MRKNLIRILCLVVLLVTVIAPTALANHGYYTVISSKKANLRSSRYTHANNRVGHVLPGEEVLVYDWYENRTWAYVEALCEDGRVRKGYMQSRLLSRSGSRKSSTPKRETSDPVMRSVVPYTAWVRPFKAGSFIYLRKGPGKQYGWIERCYENTEVTVEMTGGGWAYVTDEETGRSGYMVIDALY